MSNHLGNFNDTWFSCKESLSGINPVRHETGVLKVINDIKLPFSSGGVDVDGYLATIVSTADYSPFGVQLDGRTESAESYRYGFNGMEKDDEMKGAGNSYDFGARMYDSRLGRWLSRDKLSCEFPSESSYIFTSNNPIIYIDFAGHFKIVVTELAKEDKGSEISIQRFQDVVNQLPKYLENNPNVLNVIMEQTGLSKQQILSDVSNKSHKMEIHIDVNTLGANAPTQDYFSIDYSLIDFFEDFQGTSDLENAAANLNMASLILHEYTHSADRRKNEGLITSDDTGSYGATEDCGAQGVCSEYNHRGIDVDMQVIGHFDVVDGGVEGEWVVKDGSRQYVEGKRDFRLSATGIAKTMNNISLTQNNDGDKKNVLPNDQQ